jgi:hypothetical protein
VGHDDRYSRPGHAREQHRRARNDLDEREPRLELIRAIAQEFRPRLRAGDQLLQRREHLAAVADAERECVSAREELLEHRPRALVIEDGLGPPLAGAEHVAIGEAAAGDDAAVILEALSARQQVRHVHVVRLEPGAIERSRHLALAVHSLLA